MSQLKINQKVLLPKVTVELEDGSYITNTTYDDTITFALISGHKSFFSIKLTKDQMFDLQLLLNNYIKTRYEDNP